MYKNKKVGSKVQSRYNTKQIEYIYLLQEREFIKTKESIYKIGKTKQINFERFKQYPKGSVILLQSSCSNCDICESQILSILKKKFIKRSDIGTEYFEGNFVKMKNEINKIIQNNISLSNKKMDLEEEFHVEKIISHRYNKMKKIEFYVKWLDYSKKFNTWEPMKNMKHTEALDIYLNVFK